MFLSLSLSTGLSQRILLTAFSLVKFTYRKRLKGEEKKVQCRAVQAFRRTIFCSFSSTAIFHSRPLTYSPLMILLPLLLLRAPSPLLPISDLSSRLVANLVRSRLCSRSRSIDRSCSSCGTWGRTRCCKREDLRCRRTGPLRSSVRCRCPPPPCHPAPGCALARSQGMRTRARRRHDQRQVLYHGGVYPH